MLVHTHISSQSKVRQLVGGAPMLIFPCQYRWLPTAKPFLQPCCPGDQVAGLCRNKGMHTLHYSISFVPSPSSLSPSPTPSPPPPPPCQLIPKHQSIGGLSDTTKPSVAATVIQMTKKGISALCRHTTCTCTWRCVNHHVLSLLKQLNLCLQSSQSYLRKKGCVIGSLIQNADRLDIGT